MGGADDRRSDHRMTRRRLFLSEVIALAGGRSCARLGFFPGGGEVEEGTGPEGARAYAFSSLL